MKLEEFLLHKTQCYELCVIKDCGWIVATCWIDNEDLFAIPENYANCEVKDSKWGELITVNKYGIEVTVPCHYIDL